MRGYECKSAKSGYTGLKPWTIDDNLLLLDLPEEDQVKVLNWIRNSIVPRISVNEKHTSYGIKHIMSSQTGVYVSNNQFKDAMAQCGYLPADHREQNWHYCISENSPCFDPARDYKAMEVKTC